MTPKLHQQEINVRTLNAIENCLLNYQSKHRGFISNIYHFFAGKLGYKNRNQIYRWFQDRDDSKIGLSDLKIIVRITQDITPAIIFLEECQQEIKEGNPNQLELITKR